MPFECLQCGECCSYLGQVHTIAGQLSEICFIIRNEYTNEETVVTLDSDKTGWYADKSIFEKWPEACPFLRPDPDTPGRICCSVHKTRPDMCRSYNCWRILIINPEGQAVGRIMGPHILRSEDSALKKLWDERVRTISESDQEKWDGKVFSVLEESGYQIKK